MRNLRLVNLHCNRINNNEDDTNTIYETILSVENGKFHVFGPEPMMDGSDWNVNVDIQFNEQAIICFYDEYLILNLSNSKQILQRIVEESEVQQGTKKLILQLVIQIMF